MDKYFTQTDPKWKNVEFPYYKKTIGQIGCLVTSITNILLKRGLSLTPEVVLSMLVSNRGITKENLVLWDSVYTLFKLKHTKYSKNTFEKMDKSLLEKDYYIVEIDCVTYTHFCNVVKFEDDKIRYFDVYDGKIKSIGFDKIVSIRRFEDC